MALLFTIGANFTSSCLVVDAAKMGAHSTGIASSLINLSKITFTCLVILVILLLPETLETVTYFIFGVLLVCAFGYLKIRKSF